MHRNKRKFTQQERLDILREAEQMGIEETLRKHNLSRSGHANGFNHLKPMSTDHPNLFIVKWLKWSPKIGENYSI